MTPEELNALRSIMKEELTDQRKEIMRDVAVLMDAEFKPKFNLLAEELSIIRERLPSADTLDEMDRRIDFMNSTLKLCSKELREHKKEIEKLKKAE